MLFRSISYIAGAGIRSTVTAGLSNEFKPDVIWGSVQQGLLRGATSLGMEWAMDKLDVDPLLGVVISRAAAGAIEGLLTKTGLLNGAVTGLIDAGIKTLTLGGLVEPPDPYSSFYKAHPDLLNQAWAQYYWDDALHASQMLNLSHLIEERGLAPAIESVASSIFLSETLDSIWRQGGIADLITGTAVITHNEKKDIDVKRVFLNADHTDYIDFTVDGKDIVAIKQGNIYENSTFFYGPDGKPYPINSTKWIDNVDGTQTVNHIMDFKLTLSEKYDADGIMIEAIYPRAGQDGIIINHYTGKVLDGHVIDFENGYEYTVNQGKMVEFIDKKFFSRDNNRGFLGVGGAYFSKELGFDEYQNADLNNFILKITENNGDVNVSVDLTSPDSVTLETLSTWGKLTNYVKNYLLPGISQSQEIYGGQYMQIPTGANSYMIVDKTQGYAPVEIYQNGFKIMGELELSGGARVINGGIVYDIGQSSYLVAKIDNGSPTYIQYRGSSSLAVFNGQKDLNDKLINGELTVMGRDVIVFQNGTPIGYYKTGDPNHSIKPLDYDKMVSLVTGIFDSNGQISQNGIGNGMPNGVEPDFLAYHNAIFTQHNELFGDKPITKDATLPVFLNSEAGLPIESLHQAYDLVRDTIFGVALNQAIDHLTNETRVAFNDRYANSSDYNPFEGYSRIFESGSKTSSIRQVNEDYGRVYTMIGVSGNMSDKISNP